MKTAEEYLQELFKDCSCECEAKAEEKEALVNAILLDAFKAGMTEAAAIVKDSELRFPMATIQIREAQKAILTARDNKTKLN